MKFSRAGSELGGGCGAMVLWRVVGRLGVSGQRVMFLDPPERLIYLCFVRCAWCMRRGIGKCREYKQGKDQEKGYENAESVGLWGT